MIQPADFYFFPEDGVCMMIFGVTNDQRRVDFSIWIILIQGLRLRYKFLVNLVKH